MLYDSICSCPVLFDTHLAIVSWLVRHDMNPTMAHVLYLCGERLVRAEHLQMLHQHALPFCLLEKNAHNQI